MHRTDIRTTWYDLSEPQPARRLDVSPQQQSMNTRPPALTHAARAATAGRKAQKVQRKLQEAEAELHAANGILVEAVPTRDREKIDEALEQNIAAEEKVHDAAEELEVVRELLADDAAPDNRVAPAERAAGQSGQGVKSLIPHLSRKSGTT